MEKLFSINFGVSSPYFDKETPEYNRIFIRAQVNYMNDRLRAVGHVFLNELNDALGLPRTKDGQIFGWVKSCDAYVDITETYPPDTTDTVLLVRARDILDVFMDER